MGLRDAQRLGPIRAAAEGRITNQKAAELTGLSLRQVKRLKARVRQSGPKGLLHGNRGRPSPRRLDEAVRGEAILLLQHPEARLNDCHVRDVLAERGIEISAESVRGIRRSLGLGPKRRRRPPRHHRRRLRAARRGSLALIDGSSFAWLGPKHPEFTLVGTLDDATGEPLSLVRRPHEDLHGFTLALRDMILRYGRPEALYGDRTGIAVRNDSYWSVEEELEGRRRPTQFGQMLEELGIHYIPANSPEAKGRIERLWQTLQDRLPAEIALRHIHTLDEFDTFLPDFLERCRTWFARSPREQAPAWRPAPPQLDRMLACRYTRVVARDNVIAIHGREIQIPPGPHGGSFHNRRVEIRELLDGRLLLLDRGKLLLEHPAPPGPFTLTPVNELRRRRNRPRRLPPIRKKAPAPKPLLDRSLSTNVHKARKPARVHAWRPRFDSNSQPPKAGTRG